MEPPLLSMTQTNAMPALGVAARARSITWKADARHTRNDCGKVSTPRRFLRPRRPRAVFGSPCRQRALDLFHARALVVVEGGEVAVIVADLDDEAHLGP